MGIDDDRQISRFIPDRLPEFVRVDHPTLVSFLEAYYEWLGLRRDAGIVLSPMQMHDIPDVDSSLDQFIKNFKSQYLFNFPESLAISRETGSPVDVRRLVKNIKQFYQAKGTEKSYEFLFRILYDTNVEFYYPKTDILRLSSGRWTQNNYLRVSNTLGDQIFNAAGKLIVQRNAAGQVIATAKVVSANVYQIDNFDVAELLITGRNGTFLAGDLGIEFESEGRTLREIRVFSVVSTVDIVNGGSDYQIGERVNFVPAQGDSGQRGRGTVAEVDATGSIRKINIDDFGINYNTVPAIVVETNRGVGFSGTVTVGALCQSFGYYTNNDGRLSTNKVIQDNHYYQNWSYVLKSEVVIDTYREVIRRLVHPVGTAMFGSVLVKRCSKADLHNATALMSFRIPYIGNYAAYTINTFDDLSLWFQESITGGMTAAGYAPDTHDALIAQQGDGLAALGNPISNNIPFVGATSGILTTAGFPDADPFWIVYPHANKQVDRGYHYARIWRNQARQAVTWSEWYYNKEKDYSESRYQWMREADSTLDQTDSLAQFQRYVTMASGIGNDGGIAGDNPPHAFICCIPNASAGEPGCDGNCGTPPLAPCLPLCQCEGGEWNNGICTCPNGLIGVWNDDQGKYICPPDSGGDVGPPTEGPCPWCLCGCDNFPTCNECPPCADPCQDPRCSNYDCCACEGLGSDCCTKPTPCWIDPFSGGQDPCDCEELWRFNPGYVIGECCARGRCTNACAAFCQLYPFLDICRRTDGTTGELCDICPCNASCPDRFCLPQCPTYDPCRIACDNFDYCSTGCSGYGPCHPSCPSFDICTSTGCSSYNPCNQICSPDPCATGTACYDGCVCGNPCDQSCAGFNWCYCDLGGATCCAENPCIPECNPDPCDENGPCYDPCEPTCPDFSPCLTACPGYGPCHPDCPEPPVGQYTRNLRPCNPLCPGFDRCNKNCPNYDSDFCCQGCNCGGGGGIGSPVFGSAGNSIRQYENDNPFPRTQDNNPCNNDIASCLVGPHNYDQNAFSGTLLKYDENSEFGKITLRAFFNMPSGEAFDCREETINGVALPQFVVSSPIMGQSVSSSNPDRPLTIRYTVTNSENIGYHKIVQTNIYIDNSLISTISINMTEFTVMGIADGRRTLKLEMIDADGNLVAGTQKLVLFGYEYMQTAEAQAIRDVSVPTELVNPLSFLLPRIADTLGNIRNDTPNQTSAMLSTDQPIVQDAPFELTEGPNLSLNRGGRRDNTCRIACDNEWDEKVRQKENLYEDQRQENTREWSRCIRDARDNRLGELFNEWLQGGTGGGLLPEGGPVQFPLKPCCLGFAEGVTCPDGAERLCIDPECIDYGDGRLKVWEFVNASFKCGIEGCFEGLAWNKNDRDAGGPPPYNGPNWCLDDTQKQIDDAILGLQRDLCVLEACEGPVSRDCPGKHPNIVEICKLEALKRLRCDLYETHKTTGVVACELNRQAAEEMMKAHRKHCGEIPTAENPCGRWSGDGGDSIAGDEGNALVNCNLNMNREADEQYGKLNELMRQLASDTSESMKNLQTRYEAEVAACGCTGVNYSDIFDPTLFPNWHYARQVYGPGSLPPQWVYPLDRGGWIVDDKMGRERFWREYYPNWLPIRPSYFE